MEQTQQLKPLLGEDGLDAVELLKVAHLHSAAQALARVGGARSEDRRFKIPHGPWRVCSRPCEYERAWKSVRVSAVVSMGKGIRESVR
eukprot:3845497-Pleurochrysis_carterae.AAC.3